MLDVDTHSLTVRHEVADLKWRKLQGCIEPFPRSTCDSGNGIV